MEVKIDLKATLFESVTITPAPDDAGDMGVMLTFVYYEKSANEDSKYKYFHVAFTRNEVIDLINIIYFLLEVEA